MIDDSMLAAGATELIQRCLEVRPDETVLVLTDAHTASLARHIHEAAASVACATTVLLPSLNDDYELAYGRLEQTLLEWRPNVVIFAARDDQDHLAWDDRYWKLLEAVGARSAQMPALDAQSLGPGMSMDYRAVGRHTELVTSVATGTSIITVLNALGTDIELRCDPERPWTPFTGHYPRPGDGGRLPQGETFCSPIDASGVIAASVIGYPFNAATGLLREPALFEIEDGRLRRVTHPDGQLQQQLRDWFGRDAQAGRVGEFALGTNPWCTEITGNLLFDENVPGCHIALGHPFGDYTGADWTSGVHVDLVVKQPTIRLDGKTILRDGEYQDLASFVVPHTNTERSR